LVKTRGDHWNYHFNPIQSWKVASDGSVQNALG
jgi:hypothetical protein